MSIIKQVDTEGDEAVVGLSGEVDMHSSNTLRRELIAFTRDKVERIVVDLASVTYIDSSGLATLIEAHKTATAYGGKLIMRNAQPKVTAVFKLAHLLSFFEFE